MAEVTLAVQAVNPSGVTPSYTSVLTANTYLVNNNGNVLLHIKNAGASSCTVTIETPHTVGGLAIADKTVVVPATTGDVMIAAFPPGIYNGSNSNMKVTFSSEDSVSVAAVRL